MAGRGIGKSPSRGLSTDADKADKRPAKDWQLANAKRLNEKPRLRMSTDTRQTVKVPEDAEGVLRKELHRQAIGRNFITWLYQMADSDSTPFQMRLEIIRLLCQMLLSNGAKRAGRPANPKETPEDTQEFLKSLSLLSATEKRKSILEATGESDIEIDEDDLEPLPDIEEEEEI